MEETISIVELIQILKKKALLIIMTTIAKIGLAAGVTFFMLTPIYDSAAQLIVQNKQAEGTNLQNDINGNLMLINTYKDMIKGDIMIDAVQKELQKEYQFTYSNSELKDIIEVEQAQNSQMFRIIANSPEPRKAATIANVTAGIFQKKAEDVLEVSKVTITSKGVVPSKAIFPNNKLNLLIGAVVGMMLGVGLAFLIELFDKTVKDDRFIAESLGLPILGQVSEISKKDLFENRGVIVKTPEETQRMGARTVNSRKRKRV
ncbi:YveK family protein [Enterococcus avium]|uniref:YveK family protein n=1 Tax=Enterococcus avium TaxID=33945 RepID=UPI00288FDB8C|nr:Wzz/FepE/Etk N-terminal domain-containing protein [Enterococcus avium]MDT2472004.1 Wzz/FepE/Etk N-terminal domain-containing protein [Enterococcus avium]